MDVYTGTTQGFHKYIGPSIKNAVNSLARKARTARNSGLDRIQVIGIDQKAREARHLSYIRENVYLSEKAEYNRRDLHTDVFPPFYQWLRNRGA